MGSTAFWSALRKYVVANRFGLTGTSTLLRDARRRDVGRSLEAVPAALPQVLLTDAAVRGERLRHLPERGR